MAIMCNINVSRLILVVSFLDQLKLFAFGVDSSSLVLLEALGELN